MRGATTALALPAVSLGEGLPAAFLLGGITSGLVDALDAVLAPAVSVLDDLDAYLDLRYAPDDCVRWLGSWLNTGVDGRWPAERLRLRRADLVTALVGRGTVRGLAAGVRACSGYDPLVRDNGGVSWSNRPGGRLPGRQTPSLEIEVPYDARDGAGIVALVRAVVEDLRPVDVPASVQFRPLP